MMWVGGLGLAPGGLFAYHHTVNTTKPMIQQKVQEAVDTSIDRAVDNSDALIKQIIQLALERTYAKIHSKTEKSADPAVDTDNSATTTQPDGPGHLKKLLKILPQKASQQLTMDNFHEAALLLQQFQNQDFDRLATQIVDNMMHGDNTEQAGQKLKQEAKHLLKNHIQDAMAEKAKQPAVFDSSYQKITHGIELKASIAAIPAALCLLMFFAGGIITRQEFKKLQAELLKGKATTP